ncbi:MAG: RpiB/LacA/LacB family sugar-phosphate isomerase [Tannerella sp.]|jgi:ribose 5-phosphate isomerase B|nr:RpiB/LacA/LacB family sugar-phosphate isomerase [Tannerella sp.]
MNFTNTTIGLASDHTGVELKESIKIILTQRGLKFKDFGSFSAERCDYTDFAHPLARAIEHNELEMGIALCGTGNGMAITLNKYPHVRGGLAWNEEIARLVSAHNKANILIIPARFVKQEDIFGMVQAYLDTPFEGGQHQIRINAITTL